MPDLEALEEKYREAQETFLKDRTPENKKAFKKAKEKFVDARVAERQKEEADPNHPRGNVMASVDNSGEDE